MRAFLSFILLAFLGGVAGWKCQQFPGASGAMAAITIYVAIRFALEDSRNALRI